MRQGGELGSMHTGGGEGILRSIRSRGEGGNLGSMHIGAGDRTWNLAY